MEATVIRVFAVLALLSFNASAAGLEGRITPAQGRLPGTLSVQIYSGSHFVDSVHANDDGSFAVRNLRSGTYEVRVVDMRGDPVSSEHVTVGTFTGPLEIRVHGIRQERAPSGSVSLKELTTKLSGAVKKEFARADKAWQRGDVRSSISHLRKAVEMCAGCTQAHNKLGGRLMKTGAFAEARQSFQRAVDLDPDSAIAQANLALASITLKDSAAAELHARRALELDPSSVSARYALGLAAIAGRNCSPEAVSNLRAAAELYPRAQLSLAQAHVCRGENRAAVTVLSQYLSNPKAEARDQVEHWRSEIIAGHP